MYKGWLKSSLVALALALVWVNSTFAQVQYFNRIHIFGNNENNLLATDTGYVVLQQGNNAGNDHELELQYFDLKGNYVKMDSFDMGYFYEDCRNCLKPYKRGWLKLATVFYTGNSAGMHLTYFNKDLDTLKTWDYSYQNLQLTDAMGLVVNGDEIILLGNHLNLSNSQFEGLAVWLDSSLSISHERLYAPQNLNEQGGYALFDGLAQADGSYIFTGIRSYYSSSSNLKNKGLILKTDSLGREVWRQELTGPEGNNEVLLQKLTDSTVAFVTSQRQQFLSTIFYLTKLRYGIIDWQGNIILDTIFDTEFVNYHTSFFKRDSAGNFVTGGYVHNPNWGSYAFKFSPEGDSIWYRDYFFGADRVSDQGVLESLIFTQDGGLLFGGYFLDRNGAGAHTWLVKTDSFGCEVPGCQNIGLREASAGKPSYFSLYPNPAQDQATLSWQIPPSSSTRNLSIKIVNLQGQTLQSIKEIEAKSQAHVLDLSHYPAGIYFLWLYSPLAPPQVLSLQVK